MNTDRAVSVLVVIPTLNEVRHIESVLDSVAQGLPPAAEVLFVVADGGSTDGTVERVQQLLPQRPQLRLMHNPDRLQSAAVNRAASTFGAQFDVLVRCDAHAAYPTGYIDSLLNTLQRTQADAVVVPMDSGGSRCLQRAVAWVSNTVVGTGGSAHRGGRRSGYVDHGHHAAFRMASFRRAGGYDVTFSHNEDAELDCRQRALGSRIFLDADIRLGYHPRDSFAALWRQYYGYGSGRARTVQRHRSSLRLRQLLVPSHLALSGVAVTAAPWQPWLLAWPALYLSVLAATSLWLSARHRSPCGLLAGPAAALMHSAWALGFIHGMLARRERRWHPGRAQPLGDRS